MTAWLSIEQLRVTFPSDQGAIHAVNGLDLTLEPGEAVGLVGESGSGKSVTALAVLGLLPGIARVTGRVRFDGVDLLTLPAEARRRVRGRRVGMVFQDPMTSLNPYLTLERQLTEVVEVHEGLRHRDALRRALTLLERVGLADAERRAKGYAHTLSGGERQRVLIAMALMARPQLLICDEPTTALDVTIQAQVLALLAELRRELGLAVLLVTHDLGVIAGHVARVAVLYGGRVMESGPTAAVLTSPRHPYTRGLLGAVPRLGGGPVTPIPGSPAVLTDAATACPFAPRCALVEPRCHVTLPPSVLTGDRTLACMVVPA